MTHAGTSAEAFHKFDTLRFLLDLVDDPTYGDGNDDKEAVALSDCIREYLQAGWEDHRTERLRYL